MSPTRRASSVPGLRAALQAAPAAPPAAVPERLDDDGPGRLAAPAPAPPGARGQRPRPPKPVRFTLDLDPEAHRFLRGAALDAGVSASVIVRALLAELRADPELAARVRSAAWTR